DLDFHPRVDEAADQSRGRWSDRAENLAEHRHDRGPVRGIWHKISHSYYIGQVGARLGQRRFDVAKGLARLLHRVVGNGHLRIIEPGRASYKNPLAVDHCPAIPSLGLETRAGGNEPPHIRTQYSAFTAKPDPGRE